MEERQSLFVRATDQISYWMGHPLNITLWAVVLGVWFTLFGLHVLGPGSSILPAWFTSNAFNFPLNTITTVMELFIGFLVGAAANRAERAIMSRSAQDFQMSRAFEARAGELLTELEDRGAKIQTILHRVETLMEETRAAQAALLEENNGR